MQSALPIAEQGPGPFGDLRRHGSVHVGLPFRATSRSQSAGRPRPDRCTTLTTSHSAASPRKAKKPTTSVTVVTKTPEAIAGIDVEMVERQRHQDARERRGDEVDDHGRADDEAELVGAEPPIGEERP